MLAEKAEGATLELEEHVALVRRHRPRCPACSVFSYQHPLSFLLMNLFRLVGMFKDFVPSATPAEHTTRGIQGTCPIWRPYLYCCRRFSPRGHVEVRVSPIFFSFLWEGVRSARGLEVGISVTWGRCVEGRLTLDGLRDTGGR